MDIISTMLQQITLPELTNALLRYLFPLLALLILGRSLRSLLLFEKEPEIWA